MSPRYLNLYCPIEVVDLVRDVDQGANSVVLFPTMVNATEDVVNAMRLQISCLDAFGEQIELLTIHI